MDIALHLGSLLFAGWMVYLILDKLEGIYHVLTQLLYFEQQCWDDGKHERKQEAKRLQDWIDSHREEQE